MRRAQCRMASSLLRKYCASRGNVRWLPLSADREVMPAAQEKRHEHGPLVQQGIKHRRHAAADEQMAGDEVHSMVLRLHFDKKLVASSLLWWCLSALIR
jgi:hypothetical protein